MLPGTLEDSIHQALSALGDPVSSFETKLLGGGCINHAMRLSTPSRHYFLKWNATPLPGMFEAEGLGLKLMAETATVRVPRVLAIEPATDDRPAFILLEWLQGDVNKSGIDSQYDLGRQLAKMHQHASMHGIQKFGLECSNYIGSNPQMNNWELDWVSFFRNERLGYQSRLAANNGLLPVGRRKKLEQLMERLEDWLDTKIQRTPSLLHGDLWGGNVIAGPGGMALIDPAVYYGDREAELAFTELFGGFSDAFYRGYQDTFPLEDGYRQRKDIYNLYHLLNHLNLFGESYGFQVDAILRRYMGE